MVFGGTTGAFAVCGQSGTPALQRRFRRRYMHGPDLRRCPPPPPTPRDATDPDATQRNERTTQLNAKV